MIESNALIKASAGTGKTFALATRFIRQMMIDKVDPKTIVALTFSRAAAQEIYTKILTRLCAAAKDDEGAAKEWAMLLEDFRKGLVPQAAEKLAWIEAQRIAHTAEDFRRVLRALVETQHLGTIATLDSFICRIVKNFPKEMGFQNAVEVLDEAGEREAVEEAVQMALAQTGEAGRDVAEAFLRIRGDKLSRTCRSAIVDILMEGWRRFVLQHPACATWTVESMCAALDVPRTSVCPDLSFLEPLFNDMGRGQALSSEELFVNFARSYDGSTKPLDVPDRVRALMLHFWDHPEATEYIYAYYRRPIKFRCGADGAAAIREAIRHIVNVYLRRQLEVVKARISLVLAIETVYGRTTRRMGKLTFNDFTQLSAAEEFSARGIAVQNVQYRFDAQFDHWALDEFQDTSEEQWTCLRELVKTVADAGAAGENRSAMAVGDMKQSIYTWRGASARPFEEVSEWDALADGTRDFKLSHRYGPNVAAFVNQVFGHGNVRRDGIIPSECSVAVDEWFAGWIDHVSHEPADYVKVVGVTPSCKNAEYDEDEDPMLKALAEEVGDLWARHEAVSSRETVGVLVRNNADGQKVAEYLRSRHLPVIWEGTSLVHDLPVIEAVLALLRLGDHPDDCAAWRTANDLFPVREWLLPDDTDVAAVSAAVSKMLTRQGLSRTLKDFCVVLREKGALPPNGLAQERLKQLVELGVSYETRTTGGDVDGFVRYLKHVEKRELALSSDTIRVLSIHRSKGLGIDHVFVPLFEQARYQSAIDVPTQTTLLCDDGAWVLSHLPKGSERFNDKTRVAHEKMRNARLRESLRIYYVALTRSKKSLVVVLPDDSKPEDYSKGLLMRDLILTAIGSTLPYSLGEPPVFASPKKKSDETSASTGDCTHWDARGVRDVIERCSPSRAAQGGEMSASWKKSALLFNADFGAAARHGVTVHAVYQKIGWADDETLATLPCAFRVAFERPSPEATLWRERGYEFFEDCRWETGQFDRVVFTGAGASRAATIYDFKTNAKGAGESDADFAHRMCVTYAPQMAAYRRALSRLTGIDETRIATRLLLESTGSVVAID